MTTGCKTIAKLATFVTIAAPMLLLAGCYEDDYTSRRDTVSLGAGDAAATNQATHMIDPWAPHSKNTNINIDGARVQVGMDRYQQNKSTKPDGLNTSSVSNGDSGNGGSNGSQVSN